MATGPLNISNSKITEIHKSTFLFTPNLEQLDLSRNFLTELKFNEINSLLTLNLARNSIMLITDLNRRTFPNLKSIDLRNNPFKCSCENTLFVKTLLSDESIRGFSFIGLDTYGGRSYTCDSPNTFAGKPLIHLADYKQLPCSGLNFGPNGQNFGPKISDKEDDFPLIAIWAPVSLFLFIGLIISSIVVVRRKRMARAKQRAMIEKVNNENRQNTIKREKHKMEQQGTSLSPENQSAILGDAAIICVENDRNWVLSTLMMELKKASEWKEFKDKHKLFFDVLVIKQMIIQEKLKKFIDENKRIVVVLTREFLSDDNAINCLVIINEVMKKQCKESVLMILIDPIAWNGLPSVVQKLLCEKNFIQYPLEKEPRQLIYFWEAVRNELLRAGNIFETALRESLQSGEVKSSPVTPVKETETQRQNIREMNPGAFNDLLKTNETSIEGSKLVHTQDYVDDIYQGINQMKEETNVNAMKPLREAPHGREVPPGNKKSQTHRSVKIISPGNTLERARLAQSVKINNNQTSHSQNIVNKPRLSLKQSGGSNYPQVVIHGSMNPGMQQSVYSNQSHHSQTSGQNKLQAGPPTNISQPNQGHLSKRNTLKQQHSNPISNSYQPSNRAPSNNHRAFGPQMHGSHSQGHGHKKLNVTQSLQPYQSRQMGPVDLSKPIPLNVNRVNSVNVMSSNSKMGYDLMPVNRVNSVNVSMMK